jgi:hypothetical protein
MMMMMTTTMTMMMIMMMNFVSGSYSAVDARRAAN